MLVSDLGADFLGDFLGGVSSGFGADVGVGVDSDFGDDLVPGIGTSTGECAGVSANPALARSAAMALLSKRFQRISTSFGPLVPCLRNTSGHLRRKIAMFSCSREAVRTATAPPGFV